MKLLVISNPNAVIGEAAIINGLFAAGLSCFHLRKPGYSATQLSGLLNLIHHRYHPCIALHQHHEIAEEFGITRLHYTEQAYAKTKPTLLKSQNEEGLTLSTSSHKMDMLTSLKGFAYVFYGPVFNSLSKPGYLSKLDPGFRLPPRSGAPEVVALGGIKLGNLSRIKEMNFDGAAVLGAIWNKPEQAIEKFKQLNYD
ncbi:thiamine phosphate synthase [Pedobacter immunditicola]|uniref:thiamine phosphate synthase n=1 Tax=Pedobacter immunditicola TaxID=3133440 RepID=UPI0030B431DF